jgi:hypothetical protein
VPTLGAGGPAPDAPPRARSRAGKSQPVGDDGRMDSKIVKIIALVLIICLVGMVFIGFL